MTAPDGEEIGVFVVLAEVEVVEEISLHKGGVFESGKLEISGVGFGRREKIVFGLTFGQLIYALIFLPIAIIFFRMNICVSKPSDKIGL